MKNTFKYIFLSLGLFIASLNLFAQDIPASGVIRDKKNKETIPFVSIAVRDASGKIVSKLSTASDIDGKFSTKVHNGYSLFFSYIGYDTLVMKITKPSENLVIAMNPKENVLEETVVVGYRRVSKADVTSSVVVIDAKDLVNTPVSNPMELLQGRVPGLNIQMNNGTPGGIPSFSIRGVSDISVQSSGDGEYMLGTTPPLFVVDGIPQEEVTGFDAAGLLSGATISPLSTIPFEEIDNIQALKDAAATALYGSKGAYGWWVAPKEICVSCSCSKTTLPFIMDTTKFTIYRRCPTA
jgi:hypothetical protein